MVFKQLIVETGLRNNTDRVCFGLPTFTSLDKHTQLSTFKPTPADLQLRLEECFTKIGKNSDQKSQNIHEGFKYYPVWVSTSEEDELDLGAEAEWVEFENLDEEGWKELIKRCVRQGRPLRTCCFPRSELRWLIRKKEERMLQREDHRIKYEEVSG